MRGEGGRGDGLAVLDEDEGEHAGEGVRVVWRVMSKVGSRCGCGSERSRNVFCCGSAEWLALEGAGAMKMGRALLRRSG